MQLCLRQQGSQTLTGLQGKILNASCTGLKAFLSVSFQAFGTRIGLTG
jgi:hypothetical protein